MMNNMPKLGGSVVPRGDMGIGLCYRCVQFMLQQQVRGEKPDGFMPQFAVTFAPWPMMELGVILALPACYDCLAGLGKAGAPGSGLMVARGG